MVDDKISKINEYLKEQLWMEKKHFKLIKSMVVHPDKIGVEARKKEDENFKFHSYLKGHADEEEFCKDN